MKVYQNRNNLHLIFFTWYRNDKTVTRKNRFFSLTISYWFLWNLVNTNYVWFYRNWPIADKCPTLYDCKLVLKMFSPFDNLAFSRGWRVFVMTFNFKPNWKDLSACNFPQIDPVIHVLICNFMCNLQPCKELHFPDL